MSEPIPITNMLVAALGSGVILTTLIAAFVKLFQSALERYLEVRITEPLKNSLALELATHQAALQQNNACQLKKMEDILEKQKKDKYAAEAIEVFELPVMQEAARIIHRIDEIIHVTHSSMYSTEWRTESLSSADLDGNKMVTSVYRVMRLFGAYGLYLQRVSAVPWHAQRDRLQWVMEKKINPVFASGKLLSGGPVILRDMMMELMDSMLDKSKKWDSVTLIGFTEWVEKCKSDPIIDRAAERLAKFLSEPGSRLALLGIYLIDIRQDYLHTLEHEKLRNYLLQWLKERNDTTELSIWGMCKNKKTDLENLNINKKMTPRNIRSPHYDKETNTMDYDIQTE